MQSSHNINAAPIAAIEGERTLASDLAKSQWALIHELECKYTGKIVHGTRCKFEDDNWFSQSGSDVSRSGINWQLATRAPALKVLVKTMIFETIYARSLEISSAADKTKKLRKGILALIESKRLLAGNDGNVILGLSVLTDDDFLAMLDTQLASSSSEQHFQSECYGLAQFHTYANHISDRVPVYKIRARLPWQKAGDSIPNWAKRRAADLKVIFPTSVGYEPLPSETAQPLVEMSLTLIDDHFDQFAAIGPLVATYSYRRVYDKKYLVGLLEMYSPILGKIVAPPDISRLSKAVEIASRIFGWLRDLLYLARGACVNVILLTTGLRNIDVRTLQVGACRPSGRVDMLFYLRVDIEKTNNVVMLPVPGQADRAFRLLEKIKFSQAPYLIDGGVFPALGGEASAANIAGSEPEVDARLKAGEGLNCMIRHFAAHFNIPFFSHITGEPYSAHCYRTTVAGWLGAASNLSLLLVRRLFGHSNNVMPTVYLNNNPAFIAEREAQKARANAETARQMALAASQGRVAGVKGEQLERGFQEHKSRMESDRQRSHSLCDAEILTSFTEILEQRIRSGSVCGFLTPFGVQCMRNPSDTSQPPCAKRANRDKTKGIAPELLRHVSDIRPQQCIGTSCSEAMLGPWSTSVLETLNWYHALLRHQLGDAFSEAHFIESAKQFIRQYEAPLKKVFGITVLRNDPEPEAN